jgi:hypothetical protein
MTRPMRFLVTWSVALVAILALTAGLNIVVNPYDLFAWQRIDGVNVLKPATKNHVALTKAYQVERLRPVTAALGTSRAYLGVDAASPYWPGSFQPVFNSGMPAADIAQSLPYELRKAWETGRLQHAVVILDLPAFFASDPASGDGEDERRLHVLDDGAPNHDQRVQFFDDVFLSTFTLGALTDSVRTILAQGDRARGGDRVHDLRADGTATDGDFITAARAEGMNALFTQKNASSIGQVPAFARLLAAWHGPMPNIDVVRWMIAFCLEHHVTLTLILGPSHIDGMEMYRRAGIWPYVEQLKQDLADVVAAAGSDTIAAWDFVEYSTYTTEIVPAPGDKRTATHWFWGQVHFKKVLGDVMLRRVFQGLPADFGARLTPDTVAFRNKTVRQQQKEFAGWRLACEATEGDNCGR